MDMKENLEAYLEHIRKLPFVKGASVRERDQRILQGPASEKVAIGIASPSRPHLNTSPSTRPAIHAFLPEAHKR